MGSPQIKIVATLSAIPAPSWNALAGDDPFLRHEFLSALHDSGCASPDTGWEPQFATLWEDGALTAGAPLYIKHHSWGEYVFDWAWADAYRQHGLRYYPKLLSAVPFTPVAGQRFLAVTEARRAQLIAAALDVAKQSGLSSFHCLFPLDREIRVLEQQGMMVRQGIQFHWRNQGYTNFNEFLGLMNHAKRKNIRQERRKIQEAGFGFEWLSGTAIGNKDWEFFDSCYRRTYRLHRSTPYLSLEFFLRLGETMPDNVLLLTVRRAGQPVAAALFLRNRDTLFGRYWGTREYRSGLHFETCYYQPIDYCITHGIQVFEGGAQGEHKLSRGLLPVRTHSAHWINHSGFSAAVGQFLTAEKEAVGHYIDELHENAPFRRVEPQA